MELSRIERPSGAPNAPLLLLLHGLGADEHDLMSLAPALDDGWTIVCARAPRALPWGGYSWFDIEFTEQGRWIDEQQAATSRDAVVRLVESLLAERSPSAFVLGGFSQGAAISLGVALKRPDLLSGALIMSGACLPTFLSEAEAGSVRQMPFLVQHGRDDLVLPVKDGRAVHGALTNLGAAVEYREYAMGHEIGMESLQDARHWLGRWTPGEVGGA